MTDDVRAVGWRMYEAFNTHDFGAAESIFAADFVSHPLGTTGAESVTRSWTRFHERFPDVEVVVEDMLVDGDKVAVRTTLRGIPADAAGQRPPTMLEIFRVQDGRIAELWGVSTLR
ncbi:ester cyclase [Nonomuraea guangzhouensis]|uniref:Ester cyclase n=1 Tax=Nonomuraea guangzhouensis TaxID=1291555 RepID=A0ABW4FYH3_9ACTN|nr:nuclear transport factor 2 family protein [Nonomuraea guangzhouensis]